MNKSTNIEVITLDMKGAVTLDNGMMKIPATLSRAGVFNYMNPDGSMRKDLRLPEEVFDAESMASFELVPFVNNHPYAEGGVVDSVNAKRLTVGTVGSIRRNGLNLDGVVMISDAETIADVRAGKTALSLGYFNQREEKAGVWTDDTGKQHQYTHVQRRIRGNHCALVDVARAGPQARLILDSADASILVTDEVAQLKKETKIMKTLTLDSLQAEMPEAAATIVTKVIGDRDAKIVAQDAKINELTASNMALKSNTDKMQATLDSAQADLKAAQDPARVQALVASRVSLETGARKILGDADLGKMTERQVKVAVVNKLKPSLNCDGKSDDYVAALYDDAMAGSKAGNVASEVVTAQIAAGQAKVVETKVTTDSAIEDPFKKMMSETSTSKKWEPNQK